MKQALFLIVCSYLIMPGLAFAQEANEANEPTVKDPGAIDLLTSSSLVN